LLHRRVRLLAQADTTFPTTFDAVAAQNAAPVVNCPSVIGFSHHNRARWTFHCAQGAKGAIGDFEGNMPASFGIRLPFFYGI
jgi:hypothetical protein